MISIFRRGLKFIVLVFLIMLFARSSQGASDNDQQVQESKNVAHATKKQSDQIEELKKQIEEIKKQNQQQMEALQKQNEQQMDALQKEIQQLETKQETEVPPSEVFVRDFAAGYKEGLYVKTTDDKFSIKFNVLVQLFMPEVQDFSDNTGKSQDENVSFVVRRLRLIFSGNGFFPWMKYFVQIGSDKGSNVELKDAYMDWAYLKEATPRLGQYKVPFNREELTTDAFLEFAERSIVNDQFTIERDIGGEVYGSLFKNMIEYYGGVFNGAGRNQPGNPNGTNLLYVARAMFEPFGKYAYSQGDLEPDPTKPLFVIGAAFAGFPNFNPNTENQNNRANLANTVKIIDPNANSADVVQFTADLGFKYYGFAVEAEYDLERIFGIVSSAPPAANAQTEQGLRTQIGYVFLPTHWELAFRYAIVDKYCQNNLAKVGCQKEQEFTPAINYYFWAHRLKVAFDYSYIRQNNPDGSPIFNNRFIIQTQLFF